MIRRLVDTVFGLVAATLRVVSLALLIIPLLVAFVMSLDARTFLAPFPPEELSFQWYRKFLGDSFYMQGLVNSLVIATVATAVSVGSGVAAAIAIHESRFLGRDLLLALFLSPLIIPGVVIGFSLLLFMSAIGVLDGMARMIVGHIIITFPYVVRSMIGSLVGIARSLQEAAMSLGASEWKVLWTIILPLARTGIVVGSLFAFTISLDDVAAGIFLSDPGSYTLPLALVAMMRSNFDLTIAAASVFLIGLALFTIALIDCTIGIDRVVGQGIFGTWEGHANESSGNLQ